MPTPISAHLVSFLLTLPTASCQKPLSLPPAHLLSLPTSFLSSYPSQLHRAKSHCLCLLPTSIFPLLTFQTAAVSLANPLTLNGATLLASANPSGGAAGVCVCVSLCVCVCVCVCSVCEYVCSILN